jgi:predicted DNA-binding protein
LVGLFLFKTYMKSKKLTVRLPFEAASKLKIISAQTGRSVQDIIGQAVMEWLAKNGGEA